MTVIKRILKFDQSYAEEPFFVSRKEHGACLLQMSTG